MAASLDAILLSRRVIICGGSGGVGKTTCSATLALRAAQLGRKAIVCTIDPARRLASSLGIDLREGHETRVAPERLEAAGLACKGELWAMMLDTKRTFDKLIERYSPTPEVRDRILSNQFYQQVSASVTGSQEYMAMEKLHELHADARYDVIVLDTPPTKHALDFLTAPRRLSTVLDGSVLQWFLKAYVKAGKFSLSLVQRGARIVVRWLTDLLGTKFLTDLSDFFKNFDGLYVGFRERAERVQKLLQDQAQTGFVLVTSPDPLVLREARYFHDKLREMAMPLEVVVVNRVHAPEDGEPRGVLARASEPAAPAAAAPPAPAPSLALETSPDAPLPAEVEAALASLAASEPVRLGVRRMARSYLRFRALARADRERVLAFRQEVDPRVAFVLVPRFAQDVFDLDGLARLGAHLFRDPAAAPLVPAAVG